MKVCILVSVRTNGQSMRGEWESQPRIPPHGTVFACGVVLASFNARNNDKATTCTKSICLVMWTKGSPSCLGDAALHIGTVAGFRSWTRDTNEARVGPFPWNLLGLSNSCSAIMWESTSIHLFVSQNLDVVARRNTSLLFQWGRGKTRSQSLVAKRTKRPDILKRLYRHAMNCRSQYVRLVVETRVNPSPSVART